MNSHKLVVYNFNGCLPIPENGNYKFRVEYFDYYSQEKLTNSELNQDLVITTDSIEPLKIEIPLNGNIVLFNVLIRLTNFTSGNSGTFYQFKTNVYSNCNSGGRLPADPEIISTITCLSEGEIDSYILCNNEEQETSTHTSTTTIIITTTGTSTTTLTSTSLTSTSTSTGTSTSTNTSTTSGTSTSTNTSSTTLTTTIPVTSTSTSTNSSTSTLTSTQTSTSTLSTTNTTVLPTTSSTTTKTSTSTSTTTFLPCFVEILNFSNISNSGLTFELDYENIDGFYWFLYDENNVQVAFDYILINGSDTSFDISFIGYPNIDLSKGYDLGIVVRECSIQKLIPPIATTTLTTTKLTTSSTTTQTTTKLPTTTSTTTLTTTKLITTTNNNCDQFGITNISNVTVNGLTLLIDYNSGSTAFNWELRNKNTNIVERSGTITLVGNHIIDISFFELSNEIDLSIPHSFSISSVGCNGNDIVDLPIITTTSTTTKLTTTSQPTTTKLTTTQPVTTTVPQITTTLLTTTVSCLIDIVSISNITSTGCTIEVTGNTNFNWYLYTLSGDIITGGYITRSGSIYNINFFPAEINLSTFDFRIEVRAEGCSAIDSLNFPQTTGTTTIKPTTTSTTTNNITDGCDPNYGMLIRWRMKSSTKAPYPTYQEAYDASCFSGVGCDGRVLNISIGETIYTVKNSGLTYCVDCRVLPTGYYWIYPPNDTNNVYVIHVTDGVIDLLQSNYCTNI